MSPETRDLIAPILNFTVVLIILVKAGRKPLREMFATRSKTIADEIRDAEQQTSEADRALNEWETNWRASEAHAQRLMEDAKANLARYRQKSIEAAKTEAERVQKEAQMLGNTETLKAKENLQREIAEKSVRMAEAYLLNQMEEGDRQKLVTEYVEIVGNGAAAR